jgi:DNA polymerase delta subunit 1
MQQHDDRIVVTRMDAYWGDAGADVYDLATANHHFCAGIGELVLHNTDSVFVDAGAGYTVEAAHEYGQRIARDLTTIFPPPIELAYEKCLRNLLMIDRKRYASMAYKPGVAAPVLDQKGLETVRRDSVPFVRRALNAVLDALVVHGDVPRAFAVGELAVADLAHGRAPFHELIMSRSLSKPLKDYKAGGAPPHVVLARRLVEAGLIRAAGKGDRIPFVITGRDSVAEDPMAVIRGTAPALNLRHYVDLLVHALCRLLRFVGPDAMTADVGDSGARCVACHARVQPDQRSARTRRCRACDGVVRMLGANHVALDGGGATRGPLDAFMQRGGADTVDSILSDAARRQDVERAFHRAWTTCQICMQSLFADVDSCGATDCPNFWTRAEARERLMRLASP